MKKLVLIMAIAVFSAGAALSQEISQDSVEVTASAQTVENAPKVRFRGYINKTFPVTVSDGYFYPYLISSEASLGVKIEDYLYLGLGTGYSLALWDFRFPCYIDARGYIPTKSNTKPYFSLAPGVGFIALLPAFYIHTGFGFDYKLFNMELGYRLWEMDVEGENYNYREHQIYLKLGVRIGK